MMMNCDICNNEITNNITVAIGPSKVDYDYDVKALLPSTKKYFCLKCWLLIDDFIESSK